jgi:hypothetical protein
VLASWEPRHVPFFDFEPVNVHLVIEEILPRGSVIPSPPGRHVDPFELSWELHVFRVPVVVESPVSVSVDEVIAVFIVVFSNVQVVITCWSGSGVKLFDDVVLVVIFDHNIFAELNDAELLEYAMAVASNSYGVEPAVEEVMLVVPDPVKDGLLGTRPSEPLRVDNNPVMIRESRRSPQILVHVLVSLEIWLINVAS